MSENTTTTNHTSPLQSKPPQRKSGKVKFFNSQKGYGFIIPNDPTEINVNGRHEIFVHHTAIKNTGGFKSLEEGEDVEYLLVQGPKGMQAADVSGPGGALVHSGHRQSGSQSRNANSNGFKSARKFQAGMNSYQNSFEYQFPGLGLPSGGGGGEYQTSFITSPSANNDPSRQIGQADPNAQFMAHPYMIDQHMQPQLFVQNPQSNGGGYFPVFFDASGRAFIATAAAGTGGFADQTDNNTNQIANKQTDSNNNQSPPSPPPTADGVGRENSTSTASD